MCKICPTACTRLISAALFIAVGIVQLIAGIILLNSQYIFLLAVPDFWTAFSNIAVGCLVGIAASVWKHSKKKGAAKYIARYHLMVALLFSAVIVNSTTLVILILGEGSALLSIALEDNEKLNKILAYAYAASVISPVAGATVATLSIVAGCCPERTSTPVIKVSKPKSRKEMGESDSNLYSWVYTRGSSATPKTAEARRPASFSTWTSPPSANMYTSPDVFSTTFSSPVASQTLPVRGSRRREYDVSFNSPLPSVMAGRKNIRSSESAMAGNVVPVRVANIYPRNQKLGIPVKAPVVPPRRLSKSLDLETSFNETRYTSWKRSYSPAEASKNRKIRFSSFQGSSGVQALRERAFGNSPDIDNVKLRRKSDGSQPRSTPLESITEVPDETDYGVVFTPSSNRTSGYGSSPDTVLTATRFTHYSTQRSDRNDSVFSQDETTPKKLWDEPCHTTTMKKSVRAQPSIVSEIFDPDSLVGLSHLELIARQHRDRNLWKILRKRVNDSRSFIPSKKENSPAEVD